MEELRDGDPASVGPYRLLRRLGGGGMGQVFLGRSRGGRLVAVKVVRDELAADRQFRRRFAREAEAARRVGGFYTAQVVDADPAADPPWLVTAYVPGPALHEAVGGQGPLPERTLRLLAAGLAEGLQAVHACAMVHRDLKPGNVLLAADGPRLIDFGIARALDETGLTESGAIIGTPGFMAPEHVRHNRADGRADIFALGAVVTYAATGAGPFGGGPPHAVMYRAVHEEPDLTGLPTALRPVIAACLAKDPEARPTVERLLDLLPDGDDTGLSWLPDRVRTMVDERDVTVRGTSQNSGASAPSRAAGGVDDGSGGGSYEGPALGRVVPARSAAAALLAERERQQALQRERRLGEERRECMRLLRQSAEVAGHITAPEEEAVALAGAGAGLLPLDPDTARGLLSRAERRAATVSQHLGRVRALARVAVELGAADPRRARGLAEQAETLAGEKRGWGSARAEALHEAAVGLAAVAPGRAERLISGLRRPAKHSDVLDRIARAMVVSDPERAVRFAEREVDADSYTRQGIREDAAEALAAKAPERAEAVARTITDRASRERTLREVAALAASCDPGRAERISRGLTDPDERRDALSAVWERLIGTDPSRAEHIARTLSEQGSGDHWLCESVAKPALVDPDHAERLARSLPTEAARTSALCRVFQALRGVDPERARRIAAELPAEPTAELVSVYAGTVEDLAATDPAGARHLAREAAALARRLDDKEDRGVALGYVGAALARVDVSEGERFVLDLTKPKVRANAAVTMAAEVAVFAPDTAARLCTECERALARVSGAGTRMDLLEELFREQVLLDRHGAVRTALSALHIPYKYRLSRLPFIAAEVIDHDPDAAARIAAETVRLARSERDGDRYNAAASPALCVLAQVDAAQAVRLATDPEFVTDPGALANLARQMRWRAKWAWSRVQELTGST